MLKRNTSIDFLRGIAILLVLGRHTNFEFSICKGGWAGVDLFFVLSGFLVSGLFFVEYFANGRINVKRFLIRRALKIYPMFYIFIGISIVFKMLFSSQAVTFSRVFSELFFVQNYMPGLWDHTWSLAVEEHFYLILAALIGLLVLKKIISDTLKVFLLLVTLIFSIAIYRYIYLFPLPPIQYLFATHLRIDGLFIGALASYVWHFIPKIKYILNKYSGVFILASIVPVSLPFILTPGSFGMNTIGLTVMQTGFAILILLAAEKGANFTFNKLYFVKKLYSSIAFIGIHSYSIYLWHLFIKAAFIHFFPNNWILPYFVFSLLFGIAISLLLEKPLLRWRDKHYKSMTHS